MTPYAEVNTLLQILLANVQHLLGQRLAGLYLHGSLASGGFDPRRSDIDFLTVTTDELPKEVIQSLQAMHTRLGASGRKLASKLEGSYLPLQVLRRDTAADVTFPCLNEGRFYLAPLGGDWVIVRYILREHGVVLVGPSPRVWIDPVQPDDLRRSVLQVLQDWWSPMLQDPSRLQSSEYQAFAILTMCRALYTLQHGAVVSKPMAAQWALATLGEGWAPLIEWAVAWQPETASDVLHETLEFMRYTLERGEQYQSSGNPS